MITKQSSCSIIFYSSLFRTVLLLGILAILVFFINKVDSDSCQDHFSWRPRTSPPPPPLFWGGKTSFTLSWPGCNNPRSDQGGWRNRPDSSPFYNFALGALNELFCKKAILQWVFCWENWSSFMSCWTEKMHLLGDFLKIFMWNGHRGENFF